MQKLIQARFSSAQEGVFRWVGTHKETPPDGVGANATIVLINVFLGLLTKLIHARERDFLQHGGIRQRMVKAHLKQRGSGQ